MSYLNKLRYTQDSSSGSSKLSMRIHGYFGHLCIIFPSQFPLLYNLFRAHWAHFELSSFTSKAFFNLLHNRLNDLEGKKRFMFLDTTTHKYAQLLPPMYTIRTAMVKNVVQRWLSMSQKKRVSYLKLSSLACGSCTSMHPEA